MKLVITICVIMTMGIAWGEELYTFTDLQGRQVEARILRSDAVSGNIQLETGSGKKMWVNPDIFSPEDHVFINGWKMAEPFRDTSVFRVSIGRKDGKWKTTGKVGFSSAVRKERPVTYSLHLINNSRIDLKGLRMEYCLFRAKKNAGRSYIETKFYSKKVGDVPARDEKKITAVKNRSIKASNSSSADEIVGVRLRLYMPVAGGQEVMREISHPNLLSAKKFPWKVPRQKSLGERYRKR